MTDFLNEFGQPVGFPVRGRQPNPRPPRTPMVGACSRVEPLELELHAADLQRAFTADRAGSMWTYMPYGPFPTLEAYRRWLEEHALGDDPLFHAVIDLETGKASGVAGYQRIDPEHGVIEVAHVAYAPRLQKTRAATEAMYLMMRRVFDELGYRRYEWKCDALNERSRRAAERLGFVFEGVFRQATMYKGRNRDTAWYSIIDREWPSLRDAFERWLRRENFDPRGTQRDSLSALVRAATLPRSGMSGPTVE